MRLIPIRAKPVIELYAASVGDTIIATFGGIVADGRFSGMFNSIAGAEFRNYSPGELLLANVIRMCCERGLDRFDLGIGDAAYKQVYCKDAEALYDSVIPITAAGQVVAPIWRAGLALKGKVKKSDTLLRAVRFIAQVMSRKAAHEKSDNRCGHHRRRACRGHRCGHAWPGRACCDAHRTAHGTAPGIPLREA